MTAPRRRRAPPDQAKIPRALVATAADGHLVPFVGAGISMSPPTSLLSAPELAESLVDKGYGESGEDLEAVADRCWAAGGWQMFARALGTEEWRNRRVNTFHELLAEMAAEGLIGAILTTNWDTMIEMALYQQEVPFAKVARPQDMPVAASGVVHVIKLMGCIDIPDTLRARSADVDTDEWTDEWAANALTATFLTSSLLFAGYSGASRAATRTIERITAKRSRDVPDWVVDRVDRREAEKRVHTKQFLEALALPAGAFIEADLVEFAEDLRDQLYPVLLNGPANQAWSLLQALLEPTEVDETQVKIALDQIVRRWVALGRSAGQNALRLMTSISRYVPVLPNAADLGRYWAWLALAEWAGQVRFGDAGLTPEAAAVAPTIVQILPVICGPLDRRDVAAARALGAVGDAGGVSMRFIGLVIGGLGPVGTLTRPFSVARGESSPDVVRGGELSIRWHAADDLFALALPSMTNDDVRAAITDCIRPLLGGLADAPSD